MVRYGMSIWYGSSRVGMACRLGMIGYVAYRCVDKARLGKARLVVPVRVGKGRRGQDSRQGSARGGGGRSGRSAWFVKVRYGVSVWVS